MTCRNFRRSVAPGIGFCGLDRGRRPLDGREIRPCWEGAAIETGDGAASHASAPGGSPGQAWANRPRLDFVPVDLADERRPARKPAARPPVDPAADGSARGDRAGLWDDVDVAGWPPQAGSR